ncbi:hypothetical protein ElyMa_000493700 [Elysia marginata]|uniref:Secreted protein n=1 Tax=Elysia marginata TaxID=1093978 RepID=A0AAV4FUP3_9GAST|nr:hypothetical protein ElyMa_000493700 [Elysia marginata]
MVVVVIVLSSNRSSSISNSCCYCCSTVVRFSSGVKPLGVVPLCQVLFPEMDDPRDGFWEIHSCDSRPRADRACAMAEGRRWRKEGSVERVAQIKTLTGSEK